MADISTQTDNVSERKESLNSVGDERLQELEKSLRKARQAEAAANAEILKKDIEISRLKILSEKRPLKENGASSDTVSPSKKVKTHHKVENNPSEAEIFPPSSSVNGEGQLSVEDMMKDFSDKLNENIMPPRNFANDSDSD